MIYDKGNVIEKRGIVFKDTYTPDPKGIHPAMITIAVSEDSKFMYYLTLTSQVDKYFEHPEYKKMYELIRKTEYNRLKKSSLVNLAHIYKEPVEQNEPVAFIQPDEFKKLVRKFKEYQNDSPDEFYHEIKDLI